MLKLVVHDCGGGAIKLQSSTYCNRHVFTISKTNTQSASCICVCVCGDKHQKKMPNLKLKLDFVGLISWNDSYY